ncbi:MAG: polyhydroxyalkanoic acid system family protein [Myxococcales bacterium]|nr:polyhydroxyalkanoic acid system family protein [Myxococcales bacterium]
MSFGIDHAHSLPIDDARARIRALGEYLSNKHGIAVTWSSDDQAKIAGKYLVVSIEGSVTVEDKRVRFQGKDPGMLWRGKAKDYLSAKLSKYLNPATKLEDLPRS